MKMTLNAESGKGNGRRRSLLELAPLELDCMNALWPMGEGTVREIRERLAPHRPRAYTTIMTIMDRLARKGIVERSKVGRAYRYRASLTAEAARAHALGQVVENFFEGSTEAVIASLSDTNATTSLAGIFRPVEKDASTRLFRSGAEQVSAAAAQGEASSATTGDGQATADEATPPARLDETLL